jgi:hypothetical protein
MSKWVMANEMSTWVMPQEMSTLVFFPNVSNLEKYATDLNKHKNTYRSPLILPNAAVALTPMAVGPRHVAAGHSQGTQEKAATPATTPVLRDRENP